MKPKLHERSGHAPSIGDRLEIAWDVAPVSTPLWECEELAPVSQGMRDPTVYCGFNRRRNEHTEL